MKRGLASLFMAGLTISSLAQAKGDEDKTMYNHAAVRDNALVEEARKGWWANSMKTRDQRIQWWREARFGMFIHWGIYSLPGGEWKGKKVEGYAEHLMRKEKISRSEYLKLAEEFNPVEFDAEAWAKAAKEAGMKYMIVTAKHHDGFAMYNSEFSDFDIFDQTPFKRDPMAELSAACKKYGIRFGFYYSHAFDWEHPDAPGNDWEYRNPGGDLNLFGGRNWFEVHPELLPRAIKYVNEKAIPQIKELIVKYRPDILWFDTPHKLPFSENLRILRTIREIDPNLVVNGRLARNESGNFGDYLNTADRPAEFFPVDGDWEAIPTTNESYGYSKFDLSHKPASFFIRLLANAASRGGNLLMNIGPMGSGAFDTKDSRILQGIGDWMQKYGASIHNTTKTPVPFQSWGVVTGRDKNLYLHVFEWPKDGKLLLGGIKSNIRKAWLMNDPEQKALPIDFLSYADAAIQVPQTAPDAVNSVIVLELADDLEVDPVRLIASNVTTRLLAFDAELKGGRWGFADGKAGNYCIQNWTEKDQTVSWNVRITEPQKYKMKIKYVASPESAGSYRVSIQGYSFEGKVNAPVQERTIVEQDAGEIYFPVGVSDLVVCPLEISGKELMKLLEIELVPVSMIK